MLGLVAFGFKHGKLALQALALSKECLPDLQRLIEPSTEVLRFRCECYQPAPGFRICTGLGFRLLDRRFVLSHKIVMCADQGIVLLNYLIVLSLPFLPGRLQAFMFLLYRLANLTSQPVTLNGTEPF